MICFSTISSRYQINTNGIKMSLSVVPASYQSPIVIPKQQGLTSEEYAESLRLYDLEVDRRSAYSSRLAYRRYTGNDDTDNVGGSGTAYVYEPARHSYSHAELSEVVTRLESLFGSKDHATGYCKRKVQKMSMKKLQESMDQDCPLCLEELKRVDCVTTSCNHSYCESCYKKYTKSSCPCCRQTVVSLTSYTSYAKK